MQVFPRGRDELVVACCAAEQIFRSFMGVPVIAVRGNLHAADGIGQPGCCPLCLRPFRHWYLHGGHHLLSTAGPIGILLMPLTTHG
jgi:hypothetical protein